LSAESLTCPASRRVCWCRVTLPEMTRHAHSRQSLSPVDRNLVFSDRLGGGLVACVRTFKRHTQAQLHALRVRTRLTACCRQSLSPVVWPAVFFGRASPMFGLLQCIVDRASRVSHGVQCMGDTSSHGMQCIVGRASGVPAVVCILVAGDKFVSSTLAAPKAVGRGRPG
jgi:hypothetical protein